MPVNRRKRCGLWLVAGALTFGVAGPVRGQVNRLGVYQPSSTEEAVRHTDAEDPTAVYVLDENYKFATGSFNAAFTRNRAYVLDGQYVREFRRNDLIAGPIRSYNAGVQLLDVEAAGAPGHILLLTRSALQVVDLDGASSPRVVGSVSVSNSQPIWGALLAVFGDTVYVADNSLRGFKVVDVADPANPIVLAQHTSKAKATGQPSKFTVTDLRRHDRVLSLVVGGYLELIAPDNLLAPSQLTSLGLARFGSTSRAVLAGGHAFLADGLTVRVVNAAPGTTGFLSEVLKFEGGAAITDLFVQDTRLYLLCGKLGYEIWDVSAYVAP
jgi:hypothetical protein